jgi:hypothetical protein
MSGGSMKQSLSGPQREEPSIEISPEADAAMKKLVELFSDPAIAAHASFRCSTEGPDEIDVFIDSLFDEQDSEYKQWVRRLYELGLIARLPDEWKGATDLVGERWSPIGAHRNPEK